MADQKVDYIIYRPTINTHHIFEVLADLMKQHPNLVRIGYDPAANEGCSCIQQIRVNVKPTKFRYNTTLFPHDYKFKYGSRHYCNDLTEFLNLIKAHWAADYEYLVYTPVEGATDTLKILKALKYKYPNVVRIQGNCSSSGTIRICTNRGRHNFNISMFDRAYALSIGKRKHFTDPAEFLDAVQNYWGE